MNGCCMYECMDGKEVVSLSLLLFFSMIALVRQFEAVSQVSDSMCLVYPQDADTYWPHSHLSLSSLFPSLLLILSSLDFIHTFIRVFIYNCTLLPFLLSLPYNNFLLKNLFRSFIHFLLLSRIHS